MKFCEKCGKQIMDEAVVCPGCGCATGNFNAAANTIPQSANTARLFGILSLLLLYPLGIPAIVYANKSKAETNGEMCGPAKVGFVCGIIALCLWGLGILTLLSACSVFL